MCEWADDTSRYTKRVKSTPAINGTKGSFEDDFLVTGVANDFVALSMTAGSSHQRNPASAVCPW